MRAEDTSFSSLTVIEQKKSVPSLRGGLRLGKFCQTILPQAIFDLNHRFTFFSNLFSFVVGIIIAGLHIKYNKCFFQLSQN
jgi:hypothetical protein